jgi:hypothetical protein
MRGVCCFAVMCVTTAASLIYRQAQSRGIKRLVLLKRYQVKKNFSVFDFTWLDYNSTFYFGF